MEFVGILPLLACAALVCLQGLLVALTVVFAQSSVDRAAHPQVSTAALTRGIPAGWRRGLRVERRSGTVRLTLRTPAVLPGAGRFLRVHASAPEVQ